MEVLKTGYDDQRTLGKVVKIERENGLNVGRLQNNFAVACVEKEMGTDKKRRTTQLLMAGPCHVMHLTVNSREEEDKVCSACNADVDRRRVLVQFSRLEYTPTFNQAELDRASQGRASAIDWSESHFDVAYDWYHVIENTQRASK